MKKINKSQFQVVNSCPLNKSDDADEFAPTNYAAHRVPNFIPTSFTDNDHDTYFIGESLNDINTFHWTDDYFPRPPDNQLLTPADLPHISKYTINMIDHHIPSMILEFSNNRDPLTISNPRIMDKVISYFNTQYQPTNYSRFNRSHW